MNPGGGSGWDDAPLDIQIPDDARELDRDVLAYHRELRAQRRRNRLRRLTGPFSGQGTVMPLLASILAVCLVAGAMLSVATFSPSTAPADHPPTRPSASADAASPAPPRSHTTASSASAGPSASASGASTGGTSASGAGASGARPTGTGSSLTSVTASPSGTGSSAAGPSATGASRSASPSVGASASTTRASGQASPSRSG